MDGMWDDMTQVREENSGGARAGGVSHLYVHVPFCRTRCDYCDFFSTTASLGLAPDYVDAVIAEADSHGGRIGRLETLYFGGGTPTLLDAGLLDRLLRPLVEEAGPAAEVTMEANPETVDAGKARAMAAAGVNRVSLGAQSFQESLRRNLGRSGRIEAIGEAVSDLRSAGIDNVGIDLIFGIPGQEPGDLAADLEAALDLSPAHISCYELTVGEGSRYWKRWRSGLEALQGQGHRFYRTAVDTLEGAGYRWYETSNYALPGRRCRHNLAYWRGHDYIGLGAGAWSTVGKERWRNQEDIRRYIHQAGGVDGRIGMEVLSGRQKAVELLILGLRTDEGVALERVEEHLDMPALERLKRSGHLSILDGRVLLTRKGRFVANELCASILR